MKRVVLILFCFILVMSTASSQVLLNTDPKAVSAIELGYAATLQEEKDYTGYLKDILAHYAKAEAATVEIYRSRYQDRKGRTSLGMWGKTDENYYYQRIYNIVTRGIMPMTIKVAKQCLDEPAKALYWGSLLYETCNETKELCMQFETVVCNSRLSFGDISFLEINPELSPIIDVVTDGSLMNEIRQLVSLFGSVSPDVISSDIATLKSKMESAISSAGNLMADKLTSATDLSAGVTTNVNAVISLIDHLDNLALQAGNGDISGLLSSLVPEEALTDLFRISDYDVTRWLGENYLEKIAGQEYTQKWSICRKISSNSVLLDYIPNQSNLNNTGREWYCKTTEFRSDRPTETDQLATLEISNEYSGYSKLQLPSSSSGHEITVSRTLKHFVKKVQFQHSPQRALARDVNDKPGTQTPLEPEVTYYYDHYYAYAIKVTDNYNVQHPVYEEVFDSYSQDEDYLEQKFQSRLASIQEDDIAAGLDYEYEIIKGEKKYYQPATEERVHDIDLATVSVTCENDYALESGNMKTGPTIRSVFTLKYTGAKLRSFFRSDLLRVIQGQAPVYYTFIADKLPDDVNEVFYDMLEAMLSRMATVQRKYNLTWADEGYWESNSVYKRQGYLPDGAGYVTFSATMTFKGDYTDWIGGYKYYEAISYSCKWALSEHLIETHVYDVVDLRGKNDTQKAQLVNSTMSEAHQKYPDCEVSVDYARYSGQEDDTEDVIHLLWSSDRLAVARDVETRLVKIYTSLMNMNRFMQYRITLEEMKRKGQSIGITPERMKSAAQSALERWSNISDTTKVSNH